MDKLRKTAAVLCCLCLLATLGTASLTVSAAANEYLLTQHTDKYKTQGRVLLTEDCLLVDWTASGIEFEANCEGDVYVKFQVDAISTSADQGCYFTVIVDGITQSRTKCHLTQTGETVVKIASGLASGKHTFAIYRQTEIRSNITVGIRSIRVSGELLSAPAKKDLYVEFVGDSITTAYGNLVALGGGSGQAKYQDGTQGYAYLTAQNLNADYSIVAIEGIGASTGWQNYTMLQVYPKLRYVKDRNTNYDFARRPDVVVLALGTNDINRYSANGKTLADVKQGFADMLSMVRSKNPGAKVVWIYGMMTGGADALIREVVGEAGGETAGLYTLSMTRDTSGGNGHPQVAAHKTNAATLSAFIRGLVTPPTTTTKTTTTTTKKTTTTTTTKTTTTKPTTKTTTTTTSTTTKATSAPSSTRASSGTSNGGLKPLHTLPPLPVKPTEGTTLRSEMAAETTVTTEGDAVTTTVPTETTTVVAIVETTVTTATTEATQAVNDTPEANEGDLTVVIAVIAAALAGGVTVLIVVLKRKK